MKKLKCIAFDCFGTVFDMSGIRREEIVEYVAHVNRDDFSPYVFPDSWYGLRAHSDSPVGIKMLQDAEFRCVAMSNGTVSLIHEISANNNIRWDGIVDLVLHGVYKPNKNAYRAIAEQFGFAPEETLMVTANPTFGDLEGAAANGIAAQVVRRGYPNTIVELAEMLRAAAVA